MTCDAEEYDDSDKIDIRFETYEDTPVKLVSQKRPNPRLAREYGQHIKLFFEKGLNALLVDPNFLLLYVPENGTKMKIVRPAKDLYHRRRMIKRINEAKPIPSFYYALSHLWGITEDNRHLWHEIGNYVDDENGKRVDPVSMREEKRDTLLRMLEDSPDSYWWIDVLCARSDTPLDIMGDIYACCLECIAMVDCKPSLIPLLHTMVPALDDSPWDKRDHDGHADLDYYLPYKQLYDKKHPHLVERLFELMQSKWWQRVWTWQEMALPFHDVRLMAETGTHRPLSNTMSLEYLNHTCLSIAWTMSEYVDRLDAEPSAALRNAKAVFDWVNSIGFSRISTRTRIKKMGPEQLMYLMRTLGDSARCCMNPVDYVYGVLGMLQIKIPRMKDPNAVWQTFLCEFENYIDGGIKEEMFDCKRITGISDRARQVNLQKVECMGDVYKDFLTIVDDQAALEKILSSLRA